MRPIYLDYNASTPLDPRVFEAMRPWFTDEPGNADSRTHTFGLRAREAVELARAQLADLLGVKANELVFTSGATESNNLAILGLVQHGLRTHRRHVVSTIIEHKAVLFPLARMGRLGFDVDLAPVTRGGYVEPDAIKQRLREDTLLVSVMHANNETGILQPVEEIGKLLEDSETMFHVDAAQTVGKEVDSLRRLRCDLLSISGHKMFGPKGVGALYLRSRDSRRPVAPLTFGGGQESGLRPGTLPVPLVVGLGKAAELAATEHADRRATAARVKRQLLDELSAVEHQLNGDQARCQSHVLNISFTGIDSEALMMAVRTDVAISNGSACTSRSYEPSYVLRAMGLSDELAACAVRISWGPGVCFIPAGPIIGALRRLKPEAPFV